MNRLLKAGFFRLKRESVFWLFMFFSFIAAIFSIFKKFDYPEELITYQTINEFVMYIGFFIAVFISIFVGKEHSEEIIRNKIIVRA